MERAFWQGRWDQNQIGFHEGKPNELLARHHARIADRRRVLAPLAGKAEDLAWLAARGHEVIGVEIIERAITQFFEEHALVPTKTRLGSHDAWSAGGVTLVRADIFDAADIGVFDAAYDRAALVALDPKDRARYVAACRALVRGPTLLVTFAYDQTKTSGPPWSVDDAAVRALYCDRAIDLLERRDASISPGMRERGVDRIEERAYLIT